TPVPAGAPIRLAPTQPRAFWLEGDLVRAVDPLTGAARPPDGVRIAGAAALAVTAHGSTVAVLAHTPAGARLTQVETSTRALRATVPLAGGPYVRIAFDGDSRRIAAAGAGAVAVFELATGRETARFPLADADLCSSLTFDAGGTELTAVTGALHDF